MGRHRPHVIGIAFDRPRRSVTGRLRFISFDRVCARRIQPSSAIRGSRRPIRQSAKRLTTIGRSSSTLPPIQTIGIHFAQPALAGSVGVVAAARRTDGMTDDICGDAISEECVTEAAVGEVGVSCCVGGTSCGADAATSDGRALAIG